MFQTVLLGTLAFPSIGYACDGKTSAEATPCNQHAKSENTAKSAGDPAHCARSPELVGAENCSWTTAMMAERVLETGTQWTFVGHLTPSANALASKVAAPYTVGPDASLFVVANEVLEGIARVDARLSLAGKVLEVDGIRYLVLTAANPSST